MKSPSNPPAFFRLRTQFTKDDRAFVRTALNLGLEDDQEQACLLNHFPCAVVVLTDPRLRYRLLETGPSAGLSAALVYGTQVLAAFQRAGIAEYQLAVALTLKICETRDLLLEKHPDGEPFPPLDLSIMTAPSGERTRFAVKIKLPGALIVLDGSYPEQTDN